MTESFPDIKNNLKSLRICHGSVKRLFKDIKYYENEEEQLTKNLMQIKSVETCASKIKMSEEILQETLRVLPTIENSLRTNLKKLFDVVTTKFEGILYFNKNMIEFCSQYNAENVDGGIEKLKESFPLYEELYKEVNGINETLASVFLKFKNVTVPNCGYASGSSVMLPKEECIDI